MVIDAVRPGQGAGGGLLSAALINAIQENERNPGILRADANGNGRICGTELLNFLATKLLGYAGHEQEPGIRSGSGGICPDPEHATCPDWIRP